MGRFLPWTDYPVYRFPADIIHWGNDSQQFVGRSPYNEETLLFDIESDYAQEHPIHDEALERHCIEQMKRCMAAHDALPFGYLIKLVEMHILAGKIRVCIFAIFPVS